MPWVHFVDNYNFALTPAVTVAYRAGMTEFVHRRCADAAVALRRGVVVKRPANRTSNKGKRDGAA